MITRRDFLAIGAGGAVAAALPARAIAQTPKRGGTLTLRTWDPPHFDHILAHAYKTPLTAIRAASTGLSEMGCLTPAQSDLVVLINEQAGVLSELTTRLLSTSRLEAHDLTLRKEPVAVAPLIDDLEKRGLARRERADGRSNALSLTAKGAAMVRLLQRKIVLHEAKFSALMTPAEKATLLSVLLRIVELER